MKSIRHTLFSAACLAGLAVLLAATPATADSVINDDCIIIGSQCIGFDCVNGESFGFDTLRLKENNLRIHFLDTSTAASFPDNDWRIVANDSTNGGSEYLAFEDSSAGRQVFRVFAGARANALVVDAQGDLGLGTATPVADIHIKTGDSPTLRLEQDGTSGFAPHTWDLAGNETNFFVRDATSGSTLPFRIRPAAPTSSIDIAGTSGNVGLGTSSPSEELHIRRTSTGATRVLVENTNGTAQQTGMRFLNTTTEWQFINLPSGTFAIREPGSDEFELTQAGDLTISGGLVTGTAGSCTAGTPCDGVFDPEVYTVESIDEHSSYMWENRHLRGVGPTPADQPIHITRKTTGILHELEKAHIYIEQLHRRLEKLERERQEGAGQ